MKYRKAAVEYVLQNKEMYAPFIEDDDTIEEYCEFMLKECVWGD